MTVNDLRGFDIKKSVHAYLIISSGTLAARGYSELLASSLMCPNVSEGGNPCGTCSVCRKINSGTHPDIYRLGKNKVSVDDVRDVRSQAYLSSNESDRKVFILENIEKFNVQSQNALLKVLEEPPKGVVFILTCSSKSSLLPTVLSRVCVLTPSPHDSSYYTETASGLLGKNADEESVAVIASYLETYEDADAEALPVKSVLDAYALATDYFSGKQQDIVSLLPRKKEQKNADSPEGAESTGKASGDLEVYLRTFMLVAKNMAVYKKSNGKCRVIPCTQDFRKLCVKMSAKRAIAYYEIFEKAYTLSEDYANRNALFAYLTAKL